jgi:hypothetical protein
LRSSISGALFTVLALVLGFVLLTPVGQYIALSLLHQIFDAGPAVW